MRRTHVVPPRPRRRGASPRRALRSGLVAAVAVGLVGIAVPSGALAASGTPGPEWGADQARPVGPPGEASAVPDGTGQAAPKGATGLSPMTSSRTAAGTMTATATTAASTCTAPGGATASA